MDLNSLFGFIEAYVQCPTTIKRPFLPFRQKDGTLIFPTGEFVGVYYSEEFKYARDLGYTSINSFKGSTTLPESILYTLSESLPSNCLMRIPTSFPTMTSQALIPGTQ
ncbi:hypothetical protein M9H77_08356 [Catharanthus roseus]|uniref:Uncharacterized protein n=1 Tax=Catharanthus roseus TaxID=4058 RepID=A0ACC0BXP8_CATRO|nr:hypothetical protein M9H77_08356 [Catharanthus roseus]